MADIQMKLSKENLLMSVFLFLTIFIYMYLLYMY